MRVALIYDMDSCRTPTGVTRHALAQLEQLSRKPEIDLQLVTGRITEPDGLAHWRSLGDLRRHQLPVRTRTMLRWWRIAPRPAVERWTGEVDWVYCPSEYGFPTRRALRAVTSHDILQNLTIGPAKHRDRYRALFRDADLVLSVSHFNTRELLEAFPECEGKVALVPNAAEDDFFQPAPEEERHAVRRDLGLPEGMPYLLSVANFQPRKNLGRLVRAASTLPEVKRGELALVLLGSGDESERSALRAAVAESGSRMIVVFPGYRQGAQLRAIYSEAFALVFPSLCESFGIPAVEAMAQGIPVALSNNTALPEIGEDAGWYFHPEDEDAIRATLRELIDRAGERTRRIELGKGIAARYRWSAANDKLVAALQDFQNRLR